MSFMYDNIDFVYEQRKKIIAAQETISKALRTIDDALVIVNGLKPTGYKHIDEVQALSTKTSSLALSVMRIADLRGRYDDVIDWYENEDQ